MLSQHLTNTSQIRARLSVLRSTLFEHFSKTINKYRINTIVFLLFS